MKFRSTLTYLFLAVGLLSSYGCAALQGISAGQEWSENYALMEGAQANDPAIIDGNPNTVGQSQYIESSSDTIRGLSAGSESVVLLPEPKPIHRIVIRSANLDAFDLWVTDSNGNWEKIKEVKSNKEPVIDLKLRQTVNTAGVKIRVRRTSNDAAMRRENVRRDGGFILYSGRTRALAQIAEFELYGFAPKTDEDTAPSKKEKDESDVDKLFNF